MPLSDIPGCSSRSTVRNLCLAWSSKQFETKLFPLSLCLGCQLGDGGPDYTPLFSSVRLAYKRLFLECLYFALRSPRRALSRLTLKPAHLLHLLSPLAVVKQYFIHSSLFSISLRMKLKIASSSSLVSSSDSQYSFQG